MNPVPRRINWPRRLIIALALLVVAGTMGFALRATANVDVLYRTTGGFQIGTGNGTVWFGRTWAPRGSDDDLSSGWRIRHTDAKPPSVPRTATQWEWWHWSWCTPVSVKSYPNPTSAMESTFPAWIVPGPIALAGLVLLNGYLNARRRATAIVTPGRVHQVA